MRSEIGNSAALREAMTRMRDKIGTFIKDKDVQCENKDELITQLFMMLALFSSLIDKSMTAPARNCDRAECATSKAAQNVWRKEDGGKTPYYEWLLAPATERKGGQK